MCVCVGVGVCVCVRVCVCVCVCELHYLLQITAVSLIMLNLHHQHPFAHVPPSDSSILQQIRSEAYMAQKRTLYSLDRLDQLYWFGLVEFYGISTKSCFYIYIKYICFGRVGDYGISTILIYYARSSLYIYIEYIWFGRVGFYGISTIVGYLMPNPLYGYIHIKYRVVEISIRHPIKLLIIFLLQDKFLWKFVCGTKIRWVLVYIFDFITTFQQKKVIKKNTFRGWK